MSEAKASHELSELLKVTKPKYTGFDGRFTYIFFAPDREDVQGEIEALEASAVVDAVALARSERDPEFRDWFFREHCSVVYPQTEPHEQQGETHVGEPVREPRRQRRRRRA